MQNFLKNHKLFVSLSAIFVLVFGLFLITVNFIENKLSNVDFVNKILNKNSSVVLLSDDLKVDFSLFSVSVKSSYLALCNLDKKPFAEFLNADFKFDLFPLLVKKIRPTKLVAKDISLSANKLKDGRFDILTFFDSGKKSTFGFDLSKLHTNLDSYSLLINDDILKNKLLLVGNGIKTNGLSLRKKIILSTDGYILSKANNSETKTPFLIDIDLQKKGKKYILNKKDVVLSSVKLSFLKPYLTKFNVKNFDVQFDIFSSTEDENFRLYSYFDKLNIAFDYKNDLNSIVSDKPILHFTDFNFKNNDLVIQSGSLISEQIDFNYSGVIKNLTLLKNIQFDVDIKANNVQVSKLAKLIPDTLLPLQAPYFKNLKLQNLNGFIDGNLNIKYKDKLKYGIFGKLNFEDVYVVKRPVSAKTAFGSCEFNDRDVYINVYANAPNNAALIVLGKTQIAKKPYAEFKINSIGKLDIEFAHGVLIPVQKILALRLGPLPYMTLKGDGEIDLQTKGTRDNAHLFGWFVTDNATVTMDGLNTVLTNGKTKILFNDTVIDFSNTTGLIDGAKTVINGNSDTSGNLLVDVDVDNISAISAMKIAQTSPIVTSALDGGAFLKSFKPVGGKLDFNLNLSGNIPTDAVFGQQSDSILAKGSLDFKNVDLYVEPKIKGTKLNGKLTFDSDCKFDLLADIFNSPFKIKGKVYQNNSDKFIKGQPSYLLIDFNSNKVSSKSIADFIFDNIGLFAPESRLFAKNLAQIFATNNFNVKGNVSANGLIEPDSVELDLSGFDFLGNVEGINDTKSDFAFKTGNITLKNKDVKFNNLRIDASGVDLLIDGSINKFVSKKPHNNLKLTFFESQFLSYLNLIKRAVPLKAQNFFNNISNHKGTIYGDLKLSGDKISGSFVPKNVSFLDKKTDSAVVLNSGKINFKNDKTYIKALNLLYGNLPFYLDGFIQSDGSVNPEFNLYFTTNLNDADCDKLLNPYLKYPIALTNEVIVKGRILGNFDSYLTYLTLILDKGSDLSFMGFKFDDMDSKREIASKIKFNKNYADVNYIRYFKYIDSQNNKQTPYDLIKLSGGLKLNKNNITLNNFKVYTPNPAPVRFLNLLFKKSIVKSGLFQSDVVLNGSLPDIGAKGKLSFSNVVIPSFKSKIDDIKISLEEKTGRAEFMLTLFDTNAKFIVDFLNKASLPVVIDNISIHSEVVLIKNLMNAFTTFANSASKMSADSVVSGDNNFVAFKPSDVLIKKGNLSVDKLIFNDIEAQNLKLNFSHSKDIVLKIDDAYLAIAGGLIKGEGAYNFDAKDVNVTSDFINCDANELTKAFFNLSDQIYGNANGKIKFSMKDFTPTNYIEKINAEAEFEVLNGKMPKLGSIEYLLRASNFFKSGIFGFTINNVLELLKPYKQGEFNKINGNIKISDAVISDLKIYSQGENLSTYTHGSYDILSGLANIEVLGKLSKKISNLLGSIGNASMVSVLNKLTGDKVDELMKTEAMKNINKIPFIDLNNDDFRLFNVKLNGHIHKEDVVKSFVWLN